MVWKNSKILIKKKKPITVKNIQTQKKYNNFEIIYKKKQILKRSGMSFGINTLTGKKIKDAFVIAELKKIYIKKVPKFILRRKKRKNGDTFLKNLLVKKIKDSNRLRAKTNDSDNLFLSNSKFLKISNIKYIPNLFNYKWNALLSGSIVNNKQRSYLQSRIDLSYTLYEENKKHINKEIDHVKRFILFNKKNLETKQDDICYNSFIKTYTYKNLMFRSFWFNKFVSTLVKCGKKLKVWNYILRSFNFLKNEFGRNPVVMLFEILELYRMPIKGLLPKSTTRKSIIRTHLIPWWKQYTQILRWIRHAFTGSVKNYTSWNTRIKTELLNLITESNSSLVKKRVEANFQLIVFGRVALHFRWHRRYNRRAVKAIKVIDRALYN